MRIVSWTPIKHDSARLPGKNWRPLAGRPLFTHMIDTLQACELIEDVYINTDSVTIEQMAHDRYGAAVHVKERKAIHRSPELSTVEILLDDLGAMHADLVVFAHCTVPLLALSTLVQAIEAYLAFSPAYDSVVSVTRVHERFYDGLARPVNFNPGIILPLQNLPALFLENNAFFILSPDTIRQTHNRVGLRPYLFEVDPLEAVDIDYRRDFDYAQWLHDQRFI